MRHDQISCLHPSFIYTLLFSKHQNKQTENCEFNIILSTLKLVPSEGSMNRKKFKVQQSTLAGNWQVQVWHALKSLNNNLNMLTDIQKYVMFMILEIALSWSADSLPTVFITKLTTQ